MNWYRLIAPDFFFGKLLSMTRAVFDMALFMLQNPSRRSWQLVKLIFRVKPNFTMVTAKNLLALYRLMQDLDQRQVAGAIVECGVWNGGSAVVVGRASADAKYPCGPRRFYLFDSFEGLPPPSENDSPAERRAYFEGWCKGEIDKVKTIFQRLALPLDQVNIVKGWFNDTLAQTLVGDIALLHIDADWYDSVKLALDTFYDRLVPGGYIMFDDYGYWQGCAQAVADFFRERGLPPAQPIQTARGGAYLQKVA